MRALLLLLSVAAGFRTGLLDHLAPCDAAQDPRTLAELGDFYKPSKFGWHRVPGGPRSTPDAYRGKVFSHTDYAFLYAPYLEEYRTKRFRLLELGIDTGASLDVWRAYFPCAEIHGVDLDPPERAFSATLHRGDLSDAAWLETFAASAGAFDVVIDDASHAVGDQLLAFDRLFLGAVAPGGLYVVEDVGSTWRRAMQEDRAALATLLGRHAPYFFVDSFMHQTASTAIHAGDSLSVLVIAKPEV